MKLFNHRFCVIFLKAMQWAKRHFADCAISNRSSGIIPFTKFANDLLSMRILRGKVPSNQSNIFSSDFLCGNIGFCSKRFFCFRFINFT